MVIVDRKTGAGFGIAGSSLPPLGGWAGHLAHVPDDDLDAMLDDALVRDDWPAAWAICGEIERREVPDRLR